MSPQICHRSQSATSSSCAQHRQAYRYRRIHADHVTLFNKQLPSLVADFAHLRFWYRSTCSKLFYVPAACQELAFRTFIARAYLSRSLILATAPCGAAVVLSDFYSGAVLRLRPHSKGLEWIEMSVSMWRGLGSVNGKATTG